MATMTKKCERCARAVYATDERDRQGNHQNGAVCNRARLEKRPLLDYAGQPTVKATAPVAAAQTTFRRDAVTQYRQSAARGTCKGCGGPVSSGGAYCGEC